MNATRSVTKWKTLTLQAMRLHSTSLLYGEEAPFKALNTRVVKNTASASLILVHKILFKPIKRSNPYK